MLLWRETTVDNSVKETGLLGKLSHRNEGRGGGIDAFLEKVANKLDYNLLFWVMEFRPRGCLWPLIFVFYGLFKICPFYYRQ